MRDKITSKKNDTIKKIKKLIELASYRRKESQYVIEGIRLCKDALLSKVNIDSIYYTEEAYSKHEKEINMFLKNDIKSYVIDKDIFEKISDTKCSQGVLCLCNMLDKQDSTDKINKEGKYIILENIQDPGNLGTILRTAEAIGINNIIISKNSCDIYSPKVLRSSMGAIFRLTIKIVVDIREEIKSLKNEGIKTYAAVPLRGALDITKISKNNDIAVAIGNEGNGLTNETIDICTACVTIPMEGKAESLNAAMAAGIIMWEMVRKEK